VTLNQSRRTFFGWGYAERRLEKDSEFTLLEHDIDKKNSCEFSMTMDSSTAST